MYNIDEFKEQLKLHNFKSYSDFLDFVDLHNQMSYKDKYEMIRDEYDKEQALKSLGITESDEASAEDDFEITNNTCLSDKDYDALIYVDGSFNSTTGQYAYGMKVEDAEGTHYFNRAYTKDAASSMRNVAGEIAGAKTAMQYCLDHDFKNAKIIYDYNGIENWCNGSWKAKNPETQKYRKFFEDASEYVNFSFAHVYGHTGNDGNEVCDSLAKAALGIPDPKAHQYADEISQAKPYKSKGMQLAENLMNEWSDKPEVGKDSASVQFE